MRPPPRLLRTAQLQLRRRMFSFVLPDTKPAVPVHLTPDLSQTQLVSFPAFNIWLSTLQRSLARQKQPSHEFHAAPYALRKIEVQAADFFGRGRLGFVKLRADVSNDHGENLPGSVFLRGGSVGMLLILQPDDISVPSDSEKRVILAVQPRVPAGSLAFSELPAGMLDDGGSFAGGAAKEIHEETGLSILQDELIDLTSLAVASSDHDGNNDNGSGEGGGVDNAGHKDAEMLQKAVYPSPGGSDEFIPLFLCQKSMARKEVDELQGRLTGLREEGEKITLKLVPLDRLWREAARDGKALAAWALYQGLKKEGRI